MKLFVLLLLSFPILLSAQVVVQSPPPPPMEKNVITDRAEDGTLEFPDVFAEFPGGTVAMQQFISENVQYPKEAIERREQGKVYLSFLVEADGSITSIQVDRGISSLLDTEAIRLVSLMPKWKPGELAGKPARTRCRLPINFTLDDDVAPAAPVQYSSAYPDANPADAKAITDVFAAYKRAMLSDQGSEVAKFVDQNTLDYYDYILEQVRYAVESDVTNLGLVHQLSIVLIRHTASRKDLEKLNGQSLLAYLVNNQRIGKGSLEENTLSVIKSNGTIAQAYIREEEKETSRYFLFHKEKGVWRIDLTTHFDSMQKILEGYTSELNISEKELMVLLLEQITDKKPDDRIWEPLVK